MTVISHEINLPLSVDTKYCVELGQSVQRVQLNSAETADAGFWSSGWDAVSAVERAAAAAVPDGAAGGGRPATRRPAALALHGAQSARPPPATHALVVVVGRTAVETKTGAAAGQGR